jgi:hypothetical protein
MEKGIKAFFLLHFVSPGSWRQPLGSRADRRRNEALPLVNPAMVCQVKLTEWTRDDRFRQPVFLKSGKIRMQPKWCGETAS